ncbi:MAG: NifB/NifX family molybdenum-iron cluster-binding protein [Dissulfurimicrobium sp.]|uniref:NifB/NifX family molybdenum-iron cluster-binding protein n=1 Tax=Dissulfurimicrobium TaxID=1769732 RepID=UPI003C722416
MKIAMPIDGQMIAGHFGHAPKFAFVDVKDGQPGVIAMLAPPPHEPGVIPRWLHEQGVTHLICGGIGARAVEILTASGINVIAGVQPMEPSEAVKALLSGRLKGVAGSTCAGHSHGHEHGHSCGGH